MRSSEMKRLIEEIKDTQSKVNDYFARVYGKPSKKPVYYRHQDGREYSCIIGGIAWPVLGGQPGKAILVGATRDDDSIFEVLEAVSSDSPQSLLQSCADLRERYEPTLLRQWIGENLFSASLVEVNRGKRHGLYLNPPPDINKPNFFEILIERILSISNACRLKINPADLIDDLKTIALSDAEHSLADHPSVKVIGYTLHYLATYRPWYVKGTTINTAEDFTVGKRAVHRYCL